MDDEYDRQEPRPGLARSLAAAQAELRGVAHDAKNAHHRYTYTSAEALIAAVTDVCGRHGLAFVCTSQATDAEGGGGDRHARASCTYALIHETDQRLAGIVAELPIVPGKGRPIDKATLAAYTECHAYALRGLFNIPRAEPLSIAGRDDTAAPAPDSEPDRKTMARHRLGKLWAEYKAKAERNGIEHVGPRETFAALLEVAEWPAQPTALQYEAACEGVGRLIALATMGEDDPCAIRRLRECRAALETAERLLDEVEAIVTDGSGVSLHTKILKLLTVLLRRRGDHKGGE
jgi:hypothetical protein